MGSAHGNSASDTTIQRTSFGWIPPPPQRQSSRPCFSRHNMILTSKTSTSEPGTFEGLPELGTAILVHLIQNVWITRWYSAGIENLRKLISQIYKFHQDLTFAVSGLNFKYLIK